CLFQLCCTRRHLLSFPTRRSSDLPVPVGEGQVEVGAEGQGGDLVAGVVRVAGAQLVFGRAQRRVGQVALVQRVEGGDAQGQAEIVQGGAQLPLDVQQQRQGLRQTVPGRGANLHALDGQVRQAAVRVIAL